MEASIPAIATSMRSLALVAANIAGRISHATPSPGSGLINAATQTARAPGKEAWGIGPRSERTASNWPSCFSWPPDLTRWHQSSTKGKKLAKDVAGKAVQFGLEKLGVPESAMSTATSLAGEALDRLGDAAERKAQSEILGKAPRRARWGYNYRTGPSGVEPPQGNPSQSLPRLGLLSWVHRVIHVLHGQLR
eukprot:COSAG03_NODE_6752_length_1010_cov_2.733260_1_plen_192_part_00